MSNKYEKLKSLLMELFQLNQPDLDFGIYRIMHARSKEIAQFLDTDLLPQVKASFAAYQPADKVAIQKELDKVINAVKEADMDPEQSPKVKELRAKLANEAVDIGTLENEVYDHLFGFFRRYYSEGDFISKRVYKEGVYAIPYEGEEVKLHWANADQYYIKTSEYLRDYAFRLNPGNEADPKRVHFHLADAAEGEHGNVKEAEGKNRVFVLASENFISVENKELVIKFEYRPATLTDWPEDQRAGKSKPPAQKELIAIAEKCLLAVSDTALASWIAELGKKHTKADGELADYSKLVAHLNRYTARNTFDYFIHKDLGKFLNRELDFYIKNEVMHLDDVESETVPRVEQYLSKIKVIRKVAKKIIDFLAQLEDFQKKLWLKKKFVVETNYCITLDRIPEEFYPEIAANKAQIEEWVKLFAIDEIQPTAGDLIDAGKPGYSLPLAVAFLKANDKLVLDTMFFSDEFKAQLIGGIENFDEQMDGLLIHSENFQALNLLQTRYREQVKCVYIDPPYNTGDSKILYKNEYDSSAWLSLMQNRMELSKNMLNDDFVYFVAIDDYEMVPLCEFIDTHFNFRREMIVINHHPQGGKAVTLANTHEYMLALVDVGSDRTLVGRQISEETEERPYKRSGTANSNFRKYRQNSFFAFLVDPKTYKVVGIENPPPKDAEYPTEDTSEGLKRIYPIGKNKTERVWRNAFESAKKLFQNGRIVSSNSYTIYQLIEHGEKKTALFSNWIDAKYNAGTNGANLLNQIIGKQNPFSYPKSIFTVEDALYTHQDSNDGIILDYFGGSGTTAHAVINLNRNDNSNEEDSGKRKYVIIEMGDHFNSVLKLRVQKIVYSVSWQDGKPTTRDTGISHCFKYLRLESYEDTLNNLDLRRTDAQTSLLDFKGEGADKFKEDYILRYMLDVESRGSASLLNIDTFTDPTAYSLKVKIPGSDESREVKVDLLETFNYLLGLQIKNISAPHIISAVFERDSEKRLRIKDRIAEKSSGAWWFRTVTGTTLDGRKILVIWRKRPGLENPEGVEQDNLVLDTWFTKMGYSSKDSEFDTIYVNGTNNLENLKTPDDLWKVRLIEEDFARLMFEDTGV